jgi:tRNA dimethylallyltransferase
LESEPNPLIAVLGPTGSGKSDLSLCLAQELKGEIVNFDSVQLYRGVDIGSAKLPVEARRGIPHHLLDVADPIDHVTAGAFARMARPVLADISSRGFVPILTGGTGFYLRALLEGLSPAPSADRDVRNRLTKLAERRPAALHRYLKARDPQAAQRIHPNDHQKLIRAIEILKLSGRPASHLEETPREELTGFVCLKLGLNPDRQELKSRLAQRTRTMFESGLIPETERLRAAGIGNEAKILQSLGYRQAVQFLDGHISYEDAVTDCETKTRQYAKRQMTWFRREQNVRWFDGFGTDPAIQAAASSQSSQFLSNFKR